MLFYGIVLLAAGIAFYLGNAVLISHYIDKHVPGLMDIDALLPRPKHGEEYLWEKTAGLGVVPKWVSVIGLCSIPVTLIGIFLIVVSFFF